MNIRDCLFLTLGLYLSFSLPLTAWANNPPSPQMMAAEFLILPLMILLTALSGGYALFKKRRYLWLWMILAPLSLLFSLVHGGISALVMLVLTAVGITRGMTLLRWGLQARQSPRPRELANARPRRLLVAGTLLLILSPALGSLNWIFLGFFPYESTAENLREILSMQAEYAQAHRTPAGQPRYDTLELEGGHLKLSHMPYPLFHHRKRDFQYTALAKQAPDGSTFQIWIMPTRFPIFPYNLLSPMPTYYTDQSGNLRMVKTVWANQKCPEDAPIFDKVSM